MTNVIMQPYNEYQRNQRHLSSYSPSTFGLEGLYKMATLYLVIDEFWIDAEVTSSEIFRVVYRHIAQHIILWNAIIDILVICI